MSNILNYPYKYIKIYYRYILPMDILNNNPEISRLLFWTKTTSKKIFFSSLKITTILFYGP